MTTAVLITGNDLRHRFAAKVLSGAFDLRGVITEGKVPLATYVPTDDAAGADIVKGHFANRSAVESRLLGQSPDLSGMDLHELAHGDSNSADTFEWVKARSPEVILLYGSSIIADPLLSWYDGRIINLHLGLSPYYRGSGTNFWPLVDALPECVGATIHLATPVVDGGGVLAQCRPADIPEEGGAHEIGTKALIAGLNRMSGAVGGYLNGNVLPVRQERSRGRLCRRRDFTAAAVSVMQANFEDGMIARYLAAKSARDAQYPIVE